MKLYRKIGEMPMKYFGNYARSKVENQRMLISEKHPEIQYPNRQPAWANQSKFDMIYHLPQPFFIFPEAGWDKIWNLGQSCDSPRPDVFHIHKKQARPRPDFQNFPLQGADQKDASAQA